MDADAIKYAIVKLESGEIVGVTNNLGKDKLVIKQPKTLENIQKKRKYFELKKELTKFQIFQKECLGNYIQIYFSRLLKLKMQPQQIFRFLYLCTFLEYETNILKIGATRNRRTMNVKNLEEILNLNYKEFCNIKKLFIDNKLIKINPNEIVVNKKIAFRGEFKNKKNMEFVKVFNKTIKELYENLETKHHKKIGYLFELLQHLNMKYNVLCKQESVQVENMKEIKILDFKEICDILGYSKNQSSRLKKDLLSIKIENEPALMVEDNNIIINPKIFYRGSNTENLNDLISLFQKNN